MYFRRLWQIELATVFESVGKSCLQDVPKLQRLVNEFLESLEVNGSPDWLVINTHLLSHLPDQLLMYGPMRGTWMYVFESFNGRIRGWVKNNAYPVQSIMQGVGRYKMVQSIRGLINVLRRRQEEATQVLPAVGLRRPLPFLATSPLFEEYRNTVVVATTGTRYHLTVDERAKLGIWMYANIPTYHVLKEKYAAFVTYANRCHKHAPNMFGTFLCNVRNVFGNALNTVFAYFLQGKRIRPKKYRGNSWS